MPTPKNLNPFVQESVYQQYGLDPQAPLNTLMEQLKQAAAGLDQLTAEEKAARVADLQQAVAKLKNPRLRVLLNAHLLEQLDLRKVQGVLSALPGPKQDEITLPALGLSQILMEGECPDYSRDDFDEITPEPKLLLPAETVREFFEKRPIERHVVFDS
jgi:hypothetical protein